MTFCVGVDTWHPLTTNIPALVDMSIINPRRACAARISVASVSIFSGNDAACERYQQL